MNIINYDIQHLRALIDRYYRGETSPAEEAEIGRLLRSEAGNGKEFADDRRLFDALNAWETPEAPAELGETLRQMVAERFADTESTAKPRRRAHILRWISWAGGAAAAASIAIVLWFSGSKSYEDALLADADSPTDTISLATANKPAETADTTDVEVIRDRIETGEKAVRPEAAPRPHIAATSRPVRTRTRSNGSINPSATTPSAKEPTPEEAAQISQDALMTLGRLLARGNQDINNANEELHQCVNETFRKISIGVSSQGIES